MSTTRAIQVVCENRKTIVTVVGATAAAVDTAVIIVAIGAAAAICLAGYGAYKLLSSDD